MHHNCRYLKGSEENEPALKWNRLMHTLFQEMLHYRNSLGTEALDGSVVKELERRYDDILQLAGDEYEEESPSDYYREGYNLYLRLKKYKENEMISININIFFIGACLFSLNNIIYFTYIMSTIIFLFSVRE